MIAYLVGSAISYSFHKKNIIIVAGLVSIACLIVGHTLGYYPFSVFVILISIIGFMYGLRIIVKSIILSIEIQRSDNNGSKINGIINIAILAGIVIGSALGFIIFDKRGSN